MSRFASYGQLTFKTFAPSANFVETKTNPINRKAMRTTDDIARPMAGTNVS
jgi:hypothetical protein